MSATDRWIAGRPDPDLLSMEDAGTQSHWIGGLPDRTIGTSGPTVNQGVLFQLLGAVGLTATGKVYVTGQLNQTLGAVGLSATAVHIVGLNITQVGIELLSYQYKGHVTQVGVEVLFQQPIPAYVTQVGIEFLRSVPPAAPPIEYTPEGSFGSLYWVEFSSPDGTTKVMAPVLLPDPSTYYGGLKEPKLLQELRVSRQLSDEKGQFTSQRFTVQFDDSDRYMRILLGNEATRVIVDRRVALRLIGIEEWRARLVPRTLALGLIRSYKTG